VCRRVTSEETNVGVIKGEVELVGCILYKRAAPDSDVIKSLSSLTTSRNQRRVSLATTA